MSKLQLSSDRSHCLVSLLGRNCVSLNSDDKKMGDSEKFRRSVMPFLRKIKSPKVSFASNYYYFKVLL